MTNPTALSLLRDTEAHLSALHVHAARHDHIGADLTCGGCLLRDRIAAALPQLAAVPSADQTTDRAALRDRIAEALMRWAEGNNDPQYAPIRRSETVRANAYSRADAVLVVLPEPADRAATAEAPLSPDYEHPECGFHWHGRDGMDIPMRDGQPVCPRCELAKVQKRLDYTQRRREEVGAECKRRGKTNLEYAEKIERLEKQLDEVRSQLGAEILRAGQAEATLERIQRVIRRLANHAVGFQDVLDDSDREPWAKTVGADIALLRRLAAEAQLASTAPLASGLPLVKGNCPACGTAGLFLGDGGYVTCSLIGCPEPDAASTVLERRTAEAPTTQPEGEPDCTCADAGDCFAPAGHYADCPAAAGARQDGAQQ